MSLQRLYKLDQSYAKDLDKLLHNEGYIDELLKLPRGEVIELVNYLNDTINRLDRTGGTTRKCLHVLRKICSARKILPDSYDVSGTLSVPGGPPIAYGGTCDAHRGSILSDVFVKRFRVHVNCDMEKIKELLCKEAIMWKRLNHTSIVPFRGVTLDPLQLVSEWMPGGELREHLKKNQSANPISLLLGIAEGLAYLHSCDLVHGDIKGPNIVVDAFGKARITDFGLASIIRDPSSVDSHVDDYGHTPRWTAPEVFNGAPASKKTDVYSFAMVMYEVFSGGPPFQHEKSTVVPTLVMRGERPGRPTHLGLSDRLWELIQECWNHTAKDRPKIEDVVKELIMIKNIPIPPIPSGKPPPTTTGPSRKPSTRSIAPKRNTNEGAELVGYDVGPPQPAPTPPNVRSVEKYVPPVQQGIVPTSGRGTAGPLPGSSQTEGKDDKDTAGKQHRVNRRVPEPRTTETNAGDTPEVNLKSPEPPDSTTTVRAQKKAAPVFRPPVPEPLPGHRNDDYKSTPAVPGFGRRPSAGKLSPSPSPEVNRQESGTEPTVRPQAARQNAGGSDRLRDQFTGRPQVDQYTSRPQADQHTSQPQADHRTDRPKDQYTQKTGQPTPQGPSREGGGPIHQLSIPVPPQVYESADMPKKKTCWCF